MPRVLWCASCLQRAAVCRSAAPRCSSCRLTHTCSALCTCCWAGAIIITQGKRRVCISMDDSVHSQHTLNWVQEGLLRSGDEVHIVVVALPVPYPVSQHD